MWDSKVQARTLAAGGKKKSVADWIRALTGMGSRTNIAIFPNVVNSRIRNKPGSPCVPDAAGDPFPDSVHGFTLSFRTSPDLEEPANA